MVIGDLVNTASRVQSAASPGQCWSRRRPSAPPTRRSRTRNAGVHELKGKAEPTGAVPRRPPRRGAGGSFRAAGPGGAVRRPRPRAPPLEGPVPFHARRRRARRTSSRSRDPAASGKSRLAWEFEKYLDGIGGGRVLAPADGASPTATASRMGARGDGTQAASVSPRGRNPASTGAKLRAWPRRMGGPDEEERRWLESMLAQLLALSERETAPREELSPRGGASSTLLTARGAVVLVFEDLQWAGLRSARLHRRAARPRRDQPRLPDRARATRDRRAPTRLGDGAERMDVDHARTRCPTRTSARCFAAWCRGSPDDLAERIRDRSEGVPLYAVETVRMLIDRGVLRKTTAGSSSAATCPRATWDVPETLQALIGARLDELPTDQRSVLQHASIIGKTFSLQALAAVTGSSDEALTPSLGALRERELLTVIRGPRLSGSRTVRVPPVDRAARGSTTTVSRRDRKARHLALARHSGGGVGR